MRDGSEAAVTPLRRERNGIELFVCSACRAPIQVEVFSDLQNGGKFMWWRCRRGHVTKQTPIPELMYTMIFDWLLRARAA